MKSRYVLAKAKFLMVNAMLVLMGSTTFNRG